MADQQKKQDVKSLDESQKAPDEKTQSGEPLLKKKKRRKRRPRYIADATKKVTDNRLAEIKKYMDQSEQKKEQTVDEQKPNKKKRRRRRKPKKKMEEPAKMEGRVKEEEPAAKEGKGPVLEYQQPPGEESYHVVPFTAQEPEKLEEEGPAEEKAASEEEVASEQQVAPEEEGLTVEGAAPEEGAASEEEVAPEAEAAPEEELVSGEVDVDESDEELKKEEREFEKEYEKPEEKSVKEPEGEIQEQPEKKKHWTELMQKERAPVKEPETFEGEEVITGGVEEKPELKEKELKGEDKAGFKAKFEEEKYPSDINFLGEKNSILDILKRVGSQVLAIMARVFNIRIVIGLVIMVVIVWGLLAGIHNKIFNFFMPAGGPPASESAAADESVMRDFGVNTSLLFGENMGTELDLIPEQVRIADYFGRLSEPSVSGETGITAATFFGELMDEMEMVTQFVDYVDILSSMQNIYEVDVYELLDRSQQREDVLMDYLADLKSVKDEGEKALSAININIDDLTVSYNSLGPDKDKFETDFFVALQNLQGEKSDALLKSFVDASQKQIALRARVAGLDKLVEYYNTALQKLDRRISAIEKNMEALIGGIRVVDVPGAGIDLIIRED